MALSSGVSGLVRMAGSWCLAAGVVAAAFTYNTEIREMLGLRPVVEAADARSAEARPEPEVRTIIRYVERPAEEAEPARQEVRPQPRKRRSLGSVELQRRSDGHFHAEAYVNGRPIQVLVDTGATLVALSAEDAAAAGVSVGPDDYRYWSETANGRARFAAVTLEDVRIGDVVVRNVQAAVSEPGRLKKTLLGMSFLGQLRMQMQAGSLILEQ